MRLSVLRVCARGFADCRIIRGGDYNYASHDDPDGREQPFSPENALELTL